MWYTFLLELTSVLTDPPCQIHYGNSYFVLLESSAPDFIYTGETNGDETTECDRFKTNGNYIGVKSRWSSSTIQYEAVAFCSIEAV